MTGDRITRCLLSRTVISKLRCKFESTNQVKVRLDKQHVTSPQTLSLPSCKWPPDRFEGKWAGDSEGVRSAIGNGDGLQERLPSTLGTRSVTRSTARCAAAAAPFPDTAHTDTGALNESIRAQIAEAVADALRADADRSAGFSAQSCAGVCWQLVRPLRLVAQSCRWHVEANRRTRVSSL